MLHLVVEALSPSHGVPIMLGYLESELQKHITSRPGQLSQATNVGNFEGQYCSEGTNVSSVKDRVSHSVLISLYWSRFKRIDSRIPRRMR